MTLRFEHTTLGQRVVFGSGNSTAALAAEARRLGATRVMTIASASQRDVATQVCRDVDVRHRFDRVAQHVPVEIAQAARAAAGDHDIDLLVAVGGGSTTGLAKAVALTTGITIVAIPTTYAGSEATNVWGITDERTKTTGVDDRVLPATVIYDASLTRSLPVDLSVASGLNGVAHCVDSLWAPGADPINQALALEGIRALAQALPGIFAAPDDLDAREQALYGCYLAAVSFASAGSGLHHKICHVLGGTFGLPHAQTHAIVLPHVLAFNAPAVPDLAARLSTALGARLSTDDDPAAAAVTTLTRLTDDLDAPHRLADIGLTPQDIQEAATRILAAAPPSNPTPVTQDRIIALLTDALTGRPPRSHPPNRSSS